MKIVITGGKGGTGKSTIATSLAYKLAQENKVLLIDTDVDCPNDNLLLGLKLKKEKDVESMIPKFNFDKCIKCGRCAQVCPEHAISFVKGKKPIFIPDQCIGCRACKIICPTGAISEGKQKIGEIFISKLGNLTLIAGKMKTGKEESSLIVNALKKFILKQEKKYDYIVTDTAAGTHCPVIAALMGNDFALAVTEPTPLGAHDLGLILSLTKKMKIKTNIILNKADIASQKIIEDISQKHKAKIIARIPYLKKIQEQYSKGKPIDNQAISEIINNLNK